MDFVNFSIRNNNIIIKFNNGNYKAIINSFVKKTLIGATITDNYNTVICSGSYIDKFDISKINSFELKITCIYNISNQINYLIDKEKKCIFALSLNNIFIINNTHFIYLPSIDDIYDITNDHLYISIPYIKDNYIKSPQLTETQELPANTHFKTIYYSLGVFFIYLLLNGGIDLQDIEQSPLSFIKNSFFSESKIAFFIERCIHDNPENRHMLYI